jgi:hypothetical protein
LFLEIAMAHVRSTAHLHDNAPATEGEGDVAERAVVHEGCDSAGSAERTELVRASDVSSHSRDKR